MNHPPPTRRQLIRQGAGSALGAALLAAAARRAGAAPQGSPARPARACVMLYMAGGPSHIDTFDPKPGRPVSGGWKALGSAVDGIQLGPYLPELARRCKQLALIRSLGSREGNHDRARHLMHTGYPPQGGVEHPAFGALVSETRGNASMPGYVAIGGPGEGAGFLNAVHAPFPVRSASRPVKYLNPSPGIDPERFARRLALWRDREARFAAGAGGAYARAQREVGEQAVGLMRSPGASAFDLTGEAEKTLAAYGDTDFGKGCLLARRLVESGVPFVEVTLNGWDTHDDNFNRVQALCQTLDHGMSALLDDLTARGLMDSTLVVWMGDFGRTPRINEKGGRDHHPACSTVVLAGGGVRGGQVVGATDPDGAEIRDRPVTVPDLYRTLCQTLDLDADKLRRAPSGRPIRTVDGGQLIDGLLA